MGYGVCVWVVVCVKVWVSVWRCRSSDHSPSQLEGCSTKVRQLSSHQGKMVEELSEQKKQISGKELNLERLKKELNLTKDRDATQLEDRFINFRFINYQCEFSSLQSNLRAATSTSRDRL